MVEGAASCRGHGGMVQEEGDEIVHKAACFGGCVHVACHEEGHDPKLS